MREGEYRFVSQRLVTHAEEVAFYDGIRWVFGIRFLLVCDCSFVVFRHACPWDVGSNVCVGVSRVGVPIKA